MIWTIWWEMNTRGGLINFLLRWSFLQNQMGSLSLTVHPILYQFEAKISQLLSPCENIFIIITCEKARSLSPFENISIIITMWKYLDYHHLGKISRLFSPCENVFIIITMWKYVHYYHHVKISWLSSPCENVFILNQIESLSSHFPRFPRGWSGGLKLGN